MTETEKEVLAGVYSALYGSALELEASLNSGGYECDWSWQNYGIDAENKDVVPYPVPVFCIYGVGGIAITPEGGVFDARLDKIKLMSLNIDAVFAGRRAEIYDTESGGELVYGPGCDIKSVVSKVFLTPSDSFRVCVYFPGAVSYNDFRELIAEFSVKEEENDEE